MEMACEVCACPVKVTASKGWLTEDEIEEMKNTEPIHYFCQRHYDDWLNNEIELPADRLAILDS